MARRMMASAALAFKSLEFSSSTFEFMEESSLGFTTATRKINESCSPVGPGTAGSGTCMDTWVDGMGTTQWESPLPFAMLGSNLMAATTALVVF